MTNEEVKKDSGCNDPQRRPAALWQEWNRSAAWDVTPWKSPSPFLPKHG